MSFKNIEVFTQSSIRIKGQTETVYVDPFKMRAKPHDADYVLITHEHLFSVRHCK